MSKKIKVKLMEITKYEDTSYDYEECYHSDRYELSQISDWEEVTPKEYLELSSYLQKKYGKKIKYGRFGKRYYYESHNSKLFLIRQPEMENEEPLLARNLLESLKQEAEEAKEKEIKKQEANRKRQETRKKNKEAKEKQQLEELKRKYG